MIYIIGTTLKYDFNKTKNSKPFHPITQNEISRYLSEKTNYREADEVADPGKSLHVESSSAGGAKTTSRKTKRNASSARSISRGARWKASSKNRRASERTRLPTNYDFTDYTNDHADKVARSDEEAQYYM